MDEGQKPWEAFTHKERDRYFGEVADFNAEAAELKAEMTWEETFEMLEQCLKGILLRYLADHIFDKDTIVVASKYAGGGSGPADLLARKYRLNLVLHPEFPANEMMVVSSNDIETAIISRVEKVKGYVPSTILSGIQRH